VIDHRPQREGLHTCAARRRSRRLRCRRLSNSALRARSGRRDFAGHGSNGWDCTRCPLQTPKCPGPRISRCICAQSFRATASFGAATPRLRAQPEALHQQLITTETRKSFSFLPDLELWPAICTLVRSPRSPALEIALQHTGGARFVAEARKHRLVVDQPAEDGATDHGMSPAELLLVSLGSCIGQYVAQYLRLRSLSEDGLLIRVEADRTQRPHRLTGFRVHIVAPGLTERQLRALEKSFPAGLVTGALASENSIRITASSADAAEAAS
jgi:putative redox protein